MFLVIPHYDFQVSSWGRSREPCACSLWNTKAPPLQSLASRAPPQQQSLNEFDAVRSLLLLDLTWAKQFTLELSAETKRSLVDAASFCLVAWDAAGLLLPRVRSNLEDRFRRAAQDAADRSSPDKFLLAARAISRQNKVSITNNNVE